MSSSSFQDADFNGLPGQASGVNADGNGNGNGNGQDDWDLALPDPVYDDFDLDEWINNYNNNSVVNNNSATTGNNGTIDPAVLNKSSDPAMNTLPLGVDSVIDNNSDDVDLSTIEPSMMDNLAWDLANPAPVPLTILPGSAIRPGFGTSAMGTAFWSRGNSTVGNSTVGDSVGSKAVMDGSAVASPFKPQGIPVMGNSATAYSLTGKNVIDNTVVTNNNNWTTANQSYAIAYPFVDPSLIMGNPAPDFNPQPIPSAADNDQFNYVDLYQYQVAQQQMFPAQAASGFVPPAPVPAVSPSAADDDQFDVQQLQYEIPQQLMLATEAAAAFPPLAAPAPAPAGNPSISFGIPSLGPMPSPIVVPSFDAFNYHQPIGNVTTGNNNVNTNPQPLPRALDNPSRPLLPHEIFPFTKLPAEIQLMIMRFAWSSDPIRPPSDTASYQQQLTFYSNPRHLRRQLSGLLKLGSISQSIRTVAFTEYFKHTQLYLRYDSSREWTYHSGFFGSRELTRTMSLLWENETPIRPLLEKYIEHVAWHIGPVYQTTLKKTQEDALKWLQNCKNVKSLEIIISMRTSHVKPKDVSDLLAQKGKVYGPASKDGGGIPWTVFKHHRELKSFVHALKVLRTEGCLDKVVFTVEDFVNESPRSYHMGKTIDLARRLERSKWWNTFKKNVVKNLLGPKPRKLGPEEKAPEKRIFYKIDQHLGAVNSNWHQTYKI